MFVAKQTFGYEQTPLTSWRNTKKKKKLSGYKTSYGCRKKFINYEI